MKNLKTPRLKMRYRQSFETSSASPSHFYSVFALAQKRLLLSVSLMFFCFAATTVAQTANPNASQSTKNVLTYLNSLKGQPTNRLLLGQDLGHGNDMVGNKGDYIDSLENLSDRQVGLVGGDYGLDVNHDFQTTNPILIEQWERGGLVTLSWHIDNPWTGGLSWDRSFVGDLDDLIGNTAVSNVWQQQLDDIADALQPLQTQGVVVLWRPLHEMNGNWFWWCGGDAEEFKRLYRDMFDYLAIERGLDNLLWVYSAATTYIANSGDYYPGIAYVDIVGIDMYDDNVSMQDADPFGNVYQGATSQHYDILRGLGGGRHPMGLTEFGRSHGNAVNDDYDYLRLVDAIRDNFPDVVFSYAWHNYYDSFGYEKHAIASNNNAVAAMQDPLVATLEDIEFSGPEILPPTNYLVFRGILVAGALPEAVESDDNYLQFHPGLTLNSLEPPVWLVFESTLASPTPDSFSVAIEANATTPGLTQQVEIFNFATGRYETMGQAATSFNNDSVMNIDITAGATEYVEPEASIVRTRIGWRATGFTIAFPWTVRLDQIVWQTP